MEILGMKTRGAIGFKKGFGADEVDFDLSDLSGLIALAGPNGHGKTTFLESLSPYRIFASRPGALRRNFFLRDSFRDLSFKLDGNLYRTLIKIDSDSDRSEGFIWKNGKPQVDGKVTNYDQYLKKLLGTPNLFYNSVFCAQTAKKLSDLKTGELRELFAEFLRLDRLTKNEETAKKCIGVLQGMRSQEERGVEALEDKIKQFGDIAGKLETAAADEKRVTGDREAEEIFLQEAVKKIEKLEQTLAQNGVNTERLNDIKKDIEAIKTEIAGKKQKLDKEQKGIDEAVSSNEQDAEKLKVIIAQKDKVLAAAERVKALETDIEMLKEILPQNQVNTERRDGFQKDINTINAEIVTKQQETNHQEQKLDQEINDAKADIFNLKPIIDKKEEIRGAADEAKELEGDIETMAKRVEKIEGDGRALAEEISKNEQRQNEITRAVLELDKDSGVCGLETQLNEVQEEIKGIEREIEKLTREESEAQQSFELVQVESDIKSCQETMALLEKRDPACQSTTCSFIVAGLDAKAKLPGLGIQKQRIQNEIKRNVDAIREKIADKRRSLQLRTGRRDAFQKDLDVERQAVAAKKEEFDKEFESNRVLLVDKQQARVDLGIKWKSDKFLLDNELKPALEETKALVDLAPKLEVAKSRLADLEQKVKELTEKKDQLKTNHKEWEGTQTSRLADLQKKHVEVVGKIDPAATPQAMQEKKKLLEDNKALAAQLTQVEVAESRLTDLDKKVKELTEKKKQLQGDYDQWAKNQGDRLAKLQERRDEVAGKINLNAEQEIREAKRHQVIHANTIETMDGQLANIKERTMILNQKLEEKKTAEKSLAIRQTELNRIASEISQWNYLRLACSKTGLQALEIDGVAPLITERANNLLCHAFGPNFTMKIVTQDPETGKEVFDIIVICSDGSETPLGDFSGGEKVWLLKALRLGMTLTSKGKSGQNFESLLVDEEDGALDNKNACNLIRLYRSMIDVRQFEKTGIHQFENCFYISHKPDAVAMADHQLRFSREGIMVA